MIVQIVTQSCGGARFNVNIPNVNGNYDTATSGRTLGTTSTITLKTINYGETITGTIQETVAPTGYRVDNKNPVKLNISYSRGSDGTFDNNRINVSFEGDSTGYTITNLVRGTSYINGDTIEIQVTDSKIADLINLEIEKKDYDTNNSVQGAKFNAYYVDNNSPKGAVNEELTTNTNGIASKNSLGIGTSGSGKMLTNEVIGDSSSYYRAFSTGNSVDLSGQNILNWIKNVKQSDILYNQTGNNDHTAFYKKDGAVITESNTYYIRIVEKDASNGYKALEADVKIRFFTDEQGLVYATIAGSEWGRRWVTDVSFNEENKDGKIINTIKIQIKDSPMYTINLNKFEKDINPDATTNCSNTKLTGATFEAIRLKEKDKTEKLLEKVTNNRAEIAIDKLQEFNYKTGYLASLTANEKEWLNNDIPDNPNINEKEMTETKITYKGNSAEFRCWHEDYAYEGSTILYQIKEVTPPEGYQPRNFYLLINTKDGNSNTYIGYQEGNNIVFNRNDKENNIVDVNAINGNTLNLNVANPAISYDLDIHKTDIHTGYGIENAKFEIKNIGSKTIKERTDASGYIKHDKLRALDINGDTNKIFEVAETDISEDYKLPADNSANMKVQIKFRFNGVEYDHYKDIPWGNADGSWNKDGDNYKLVTVVAHLLTSSGDPYFTYELNSADYANEGNKKIELTVKNTPIVSFKLNKMGGNGEYLDSTKFEITEYQADKEISNKNDIPNDNYGNIKLFTSGHKDYTDVTNEFIVDKSGTILIRFLADRKTTIIKIDEKSTDEHYSVIYEPIYLVVKDGHVVTLYKGNKRDRVRLSNEKLDTMTSGDYASFTRESTEFDIWDNSSIRHQVAVDVHNLTETWLDLTKIFTGFESGTIDGTATFKVTADKLDTINDTVTISANEVNNQVGEKYFKYRFRDNFGDENDQNRDDTNQTLTVTFTVKETSSVYNQSNKQFWAEIPEFKFKATYAKDNGGNIVLTEIGKPEAVDSKFSKTINDLYELKYKGSDRYIDITIKGDKNASINFVLRNPQVKNFDFYLTKYDQDMHAGTSHPNVAAMNGIQFNIEAITAKANYVYNNVETSTMNVNGVTCNGILKVTLDINDTNFRKNTDGNQSNNCLIDSTEDIKFLITEVETYNNIYYKFRKKPIEVSSKVIIDDDGYYRLDENYTESNKMDTSNIKNTKIKLIEEDSSNDITGLRDPSLCKLTPGKNLIAIVVPNKRRWVKLQGNVWKDTVSSGKVSEVNGVRDGNEQGIQGITVRLHKTTSGDKIFNKYAYKIQEYADNKISTVMANISTQDQIDAIVNAEELVYLETKTDENGNYYFPAAMYNGQYYVEFIYNGYKYEHTIYTPWNGNGIYSNATETESQRDNLNNKFGTITPNMQVDSGIVTNLINSETSETTTNYNGINIGISTWTGGYGYDDYVRYSATRSPDERERIVYNSKENTEIPNDSASRNVLDSAHNSVKYDYVYNNINCGITPREAVRLKLTKGVSNVRLNSGKNDGATQNYQGESYEVYNESTGEIITESNLQLAPNVSNVIGLRGDAFKNATDESISKYEQYKNAIGNYDLGVRVEDEYAYTDGNGLTANITYAIKLTNNSSEIGIQVNELVDYFDESFKYDANRITVRDRSGNPIRFELSNENKGLNIYESDGSNSGTSKNFREMHIMLENPIKLDPFVTEVVYVTFEMDVNNNVVINDTDGISANDDKTVSNGNMPTNKIKTNVAEVWSYGTYYVEDGLNNNNNYSYNEHRRNDIAGLVDLNSNPGNVTGLRKTGIAVQPYIPFVKEYDDGIAFVKLVELRRRTFSGNVWKENRNTNVQNAMIGNGIRDDDETGLKDVKVQLREYVHNADGSITDRVARVYVDPKVYENRNAANEIANTAIQGPQSETNADDGWMDAPTIITTDGNYTYEFTGVTTGDYYILFTYPDGQTYKTTVYKGNSGFNANDPDNNSSVICDLNNGNKYSDARDLYSNGTNTNPKTRSAINAILASGEINNNGNIKDNYDQYINDNYGNAIAMNAITGHINVGFEENNGNSNNITQPTKVDGSIEWQYIRTFKKENIDIGLVERPISQLKLTKDIKNFRLQLSNGTILFDASGRASNVMWMNSSDNNSWYYQDNPNNLFTKNPTYVIAPATSETYNRYLNRTRASVLATLDQELMQGATIKIKYDIKVTNIGEVDYKDNEFYYLGNESNSTANIVKTAPLQIVDYVGYQGTDDENVTRNNLNFVKDESGNNVWEYKTADDLKNEKLLSEAAAGQADVYNTIVTHTTNTSSAVDDKNGLAPIVKTDDCASIPSEYTTEIVLSKMISSSSSTDELSYDNLAEIINLKNEVGRRTRYSTVGNQNSQEKPTELDADNSGTVVLTNPFGEKADESLETVGIVGVAPTSNKSEAINYNVDIYLAIIILILTGIAIKIKKIK